MAQDTFDIEESVDKQAQQEADAYLWKDVEVLNAPSSSYENTKYVDNIVDVSEKSNVGPISAKATVDGTYKDTQAASEAYTGDRLGLTWQAFDSAQEQLFQNISSVQQPAEIFKTLRDNQNALESVRTKPWAHEASIELNTKGMIENAPQAWAAAQINGIGEDNGLWDDTLDVLGLIFWPDHPKDQADFVELVTGNWTPLFGGDSVGKMKSMVHAYTMMTPDQQASLLPELTRMALEATDGNAIKAKILMSPFTTLHSDAEVDFNTALGYVDWGLWGLPMLHTAYKTAKTATTVGRIAKLRGTEEAAKVTNATLGDPTDAIAETLQTNKVVVASDAHPIDQSRIINESTDGLSGASADQAAKVRNEQARVRDALEEVESSEWLHIRLLTATERDEFAASKAKNLSQWAEGYYRGRGYNAFDAEVVEQTADGFKVKIRMYNPTTKKADEVLTQTLSYTLDGVPKVTEIPKIGPVASYVFSPKVWLEAALKENLVAESTVILNQQMRLNRLFNDALKEVWKGVDKTGRKRVDAVLWKGQNTVPEKAGRSVDKGKTYTWRELEEGIDVDGDMIVLSDTEKLAYFKARELADFNWRNVNRMQREVLKSENFMEATILGSTRILKPYMVTDELPSGLPTWAADPKGGVSRLTRESMEKRYEEGWILARLHDSSYVDGPLNGTKTQFNHIWLKPGNLRELRANPVKYVDGYVPRIYKDTPYLVEKTTFVSVNGIDRETKNVVRLFKTRSEADAYAAKAAAESKRGSKYRARHQNEADAPTTRQLVLGEAGGLFVDDKGAHLKLGLTGDNLAPVLSASEAMNRQLSWIAQNMPLNLWRQRAITKWVSAAEVAAEGNPALLKALQADGFNARVDVLGNKRVVAGLEKSRRWIKDQLLMASDQEKVWQSSMWRLSEWAEGKPTLEFVRKGAMWAGDKDPFSALRGASFHALLGVWNPAQLIIQAQGFAVAAALDGLNPVQVTRRMRQYMALRALGTSKVVNPVAIEKAAKAAGYSVKEMQNIHDEFRISGLLDGIRTNADLEMMKNGFPTDRGAWGRILNSNLFFYKEGETFTRSYAFLVARDSYMKKNGLLSSHRLTEDELIDVAQLATEKMLNLSRANRAQWQQGAFSIPTQFMQVTTKFIEDFYLGKGNFTAAQRRKVILGQMALYGAAGVPFGVAAVENLMDAVGAGPEDMNEGSVAFIRDGIAGLLSELMFDESVSIGKRGAYVSGVEQIFKDIVNDQVSMADMATGASGHVLGRAWEVASTASTLVFNPDIEFGKDELELVLTEVGEVASTFSNAHKAYLWWRWQQIINRRGQVLMTASEADNFTAITLFKALGFSAASVEDVYEADNFARQWTKEKTALKNAMKERATDYMWKVNRGGMTKESHRNMQAIWNAMLLPYPDHLRRELIQEVMPEMLEGKTRRDTAFQKALNVYVESGETQLGIHGIGLSSSLMKGDE